MAAVSPAKPEPRITVSRIVSAMDMLLIVLAGQPITARQWVPVLPARATTCEHRVDCGPGAYDDDRISFHGVAGFRGRDQNQYRASQCHVGAEQHEPGGAPPEDSGERSQKIREIQQAQSNGARALARMVAPAPPENIQMECLGSRAQPHIGYAGGREPNVIPEWVGRDALRGKLTESCVERWRHFCG